MTRPVADFVAGVALLTVIAKRRQQRGYQLRKKHKIKLPDAIVWATAQVNQCILVTRNTKDFPHHAPGIRVPYRI